MLSRKVLSLFKIHNMQKNDYKSEIITLFNNSKMPLQDQVEYALDKYNDAMNLLYLSLSENIGQVFTDNKVSSDYKNLAKENKIIIES